MSNMTKYGLEASLKKFLLQKSLAEITKKWDVSERSVRNYCAQRRVNGAFLTGKIWNIPENAEKCR